MVRTSNLEYRFTDELIVWRALNYDRGAIEVMKWCSGAVPSWPCMFNRYSKDPCKSPTHCGFLGQEPWECQNCQSHLSICYTQLGRQGRFWGSAIYIWTAYLRDYIKWWIYSRRGCLIFLYCNWAPSVCSHNLGPFSVTVLPTTPRSRLAPL